MDAARLIGTWAERDARYAQRWHAGRPAPLTPDECSTIGRFRISEALMVPAGKGRDAALRYLREWTPPAVEAWCDPMLRLDTYNDRRRRRFARRNRDG